MHPRAVSLCALVMIVGLVDGEPQGGKIRPTFSIVGEWGRVGGKPHAVARYWADGTWSMHVVGVRGFTADMTGTYALHGDVLERKTLKTAPNKKRPSFPLIPPNDRSRYRLKWLSGDRVVLTDMGGLKNGGRFTDTWARRLARSSD